MSQIQRIFKKVVSKYMNTRAPKNQMSTRLHSSSLSFLRLLLPYQMFDAKEEWIFQIGNYFRHAIANVCMFLIRVGT